MLKTLPWSVLALFAAATVSAPADAAEVRDRAGMFSSQAVAKAEAELARIEKQTGVPILVETVESIPGLAAGADTDAKRKAVNDLAVERNRALDAQGIYMLLSKNDRVLSNVLVRERYAEVVPKEARLKIRDSFVPSFKEGDYDGGLVAAVAAIDAALPDGPVTTKPPGVRRLVPVAPAPGIGDRAGAEGGALERRGADRPPQFGLGSLLVIGLGILAVLFVVRLLSGALGGRSMAGHPHQGMPRPGPGMGGPGMGGPGMGGPGMGGPGYGRGGFFSGMLGGLGGALAGNWLYDQFSGRGSSGHQEHASSYDPAAGHSAPGADPYAGDSIVGGDDDGGFGGSWGDSGGDWGGGGDWGDDGGSW